MEVTTMATAFVTIFVAELPDKTMMATIVLSARFRRPFAVWLGAASALTAQVLIATTAGRLLGLLPQRPVRFAVAALFAFGAVVLWRSRDDIGVETDADADADAPGSAAASAGRAQVPGYRIAATVFGIVFLAEWGDLTQIATASLAAQRDAWSVFVGAALAMICVTGIGVLAGRALLRVVPASLLHRIAAMVFAALAVVFAVDAVRTVDITTDTELQARSRADPPAGLSDL